MRHPGAPFVADTAGDKFTIPKGSAPVGDRTTLPEGAEEPIQVFVTGVEQRRDIDFRIEDGEVIFVRPLLVESHLGFSRWAALYLGLFGTYRPHETVDLHFKRGGRIEVIADAEVRFPPDQAR